MIIRVKNKDLELRKNDVKIARKMVSNFFKNAEKNCSRTGSFTLYYTVLIMAHVISKELLDAFDIDKVEKIHRFLEKSS